jgi:hypothetical protein
MHPRGSRCPECLKRDADVDAGQPWFRSIAELKAAISDGIPVKLWLDDNGEYLAVHADTGEPEYSELFCSDAGAVLEEALDMLGVPYEHC